MNHSYDIGIGLEDIIQIHEVTAIDICELGFATYDSTDAVQHINR
jgi:hypothetical protein